MAEYIDKGIALNALESKKKETEKAVLEDTHSIIKDSSNCGRLFGVSDSQKIVYDIPPADVVERERIDDIKAEIDKLTVYHTTEKGSELISKKAVYRAINFVLTGSRDIDI